MRILPFLFALALSIPGCGPSLKCQNGQTIPLSRQEKLNAKLREAAESGDSHQAFRLLKEGAQIDARDCQKRTALHFAADKGHLEMGQLLLSNGADIEARDRNESTPLIWASAAGHYDVVLLLLDAGANIEAQDDSGTASLQNASANGHIEVVQLLLERGAEVNHVNKKGNTPYIKAIARHHQKIADLLLAAGADPSLGNQRACDHGNEISLTAQAKLNDQFRKAAQSGDPDQAMKLLSQGQKSNRRRAMGIRRSFSLHQKVISG